MTRLFSHSLACLCAFAAVAIACGQPGATPINSNPDCADFAGTPLPIRQLEIVDGERRLVAQVEVADSDAERARGLMCRMRLEAGTGMAFSWDGPVSGGFWMYNTYVPLDLLHVTGDGSVVAFRSMKPCPRGPEEDQQAWRNRCIEESRPFAPDAIYELAVELPAGWLGASGFDPATSARWSVSLK
ncbi:MAG: DUF192 domain-containing protein [Chloroflexi bacterium]|nr:DUF192 domain-containing protein [Chloroflexota bacterium]